MTFDKLKKGQLLISEPSIIGDVSFTRAVILLADCSSTGAVGFILNKPLAYTIHDLIPEIEASFTIFNGGPVEQDNLYFIHNIPHLITNSIEISDGIYWGGDFETTTFLINNGQISKDNIRFFLGYTGWETQQLESELKEKSWIIAVNDYENNIIGTSTTNIWKEKIMVLGGDYLLWSNAPEDPILN